MIYFAYGSNMLTARIVSRCPGTKNIGRASLAGYTLRFDKRGHDGSGKCTIHSTSDPHDTVHGVLFDVPQSQVCSLDQAEGEGTEYDRKPIQVKVPAGTFVRAETYIAKETRTNPDAKPYDWYLALVIQGAGMHRLPQTYVDLLEKIEAKPDPDLKRSSRLEALRQLGKSA
jgi:hypothetical protein